MARRESWASAVTAEEFLGSPPATAPESTPQVDLSGLQDKSTRSGMPSLPWETPSSKVLTVFVNHVSDVEALYKRSMTHSDGEWVYAVDRVARSAADYAIGVDLLSRLHWQPHVRLMLTNDIQTVDGAVNNSQLAVIREEARSLRNDIRTFDSFIAQ